MTAARTGRKQPSIRTLWAIAKSPELHLTDEDLHAVVYRETGKESMKMLTQGEVKALYAKAQEPDRDSFSIYQLKRGDETRDLRFEPYDRLNAAGHTVDPANYDLIYSAPLAPGTSLEAIFTRFNIDHPKDFKGHSLSVSDVVVLHQNGQDTAHYVDSIGYRQTPEFLQPYFEMRKKFMIFFLFFA